MRWFILAAAGVSWVLFAWNAWTWRNGEFDRDKKFRVFLEAGLAIVLTVGFLTWKN